MAKATNTIKVTLLTDEKRAVTDTEAYQEGYEAGKAAANTIRVTLIGDVVRDGEGEVE
jgi:hypothetical protein